VQTAEKIPTVIEPHNFQLVDSLNLSMLGGCAAVSALAISTKTGYSLNNQKFD